MAVRKVTLFAPLLALLVALAGCAALPGSSPSSSAASGAGPFQLTIVHSNDTWGYLDPCG